MAEQTSQPFVVNEQTTAYMEFQITDDNGDPLSAAAIDELYCTYYDAQTPATIINGRDMQDIYGAGAGQNDFEIAGSGLVAWYLQIPDTTLAASVGATYIAMFEWRWSPDARPQRRQRVEITINVTNFTKVS